MMGWVGRVQPDGRGLDGSTSKQRSSTPAAAVADRPANSEAHAPCRLLAHEALAEPQQPHLEAPLLAANHHLVEVSVGVRHARGREAAAGGPGPAAARSEARAAEWQLPGSEHGYHTLSTHPAGVTSAPGDTWPHTWAAGW